MEQVIYKYQFGAHQDSVNIDMPEGAEILSVDQQSGIPCIWALVNPNALYKKRYFSIFMTGEQLPAVKLERKFIGTVLLNSGTYVIHVFEVVPS